MSPEAVAEMKSLIERILAISAEVRGLKTNDPHRRELIAEQRKANERLDALRRRKSDG